MLTYLLLHECRNEIKVLNIADDFQIYTSTDLGLVIIFAMEINVLYFF